MNLSSYLRPYGIELSGVLSLNACEVRKPHLLSRAGYTFSHSSKRDIIIEYFFREGIYDLLDVNEVLYRLDQEPIGRGEKVA